MVQNVADIPDAAAGNVADFLIREALFQSQVDDLLRGGADRAIVVKSRRSWVSLAVASLCAVGAAALLAMLGRGQGMGAAGGFFGAGALLLVAGLALSFALLAKLSRSGGAGRASIGSLGLRSSARRRGRSLATI